MSENIRFDFPGVKLLEDIRKVAVFFSVLLRKYSGLTFYVSDIITEKETTCVIWTNKVKQFDGTL